MSTDRRYGVVAGLAIKAPCRAATTAAITLSGNQTVDGIALVTGDRCLVKNQADQTTNGIYVVDTGSWTRDLDFDGALDVVQGTLINIASGTTNSGAIFQLTTANPITIGSSNLTFSNNISSGLSASNGSSLVGFTQSGTGAVARTVQDKEREQKSITDFLPTGYVTDGSIDYTTYIQAAINDSCANGYELIAPPIAYQYSNLATPTTGIKPFIIKGLGATFIKNTASGIGLIVQGSPGSGGPSGTKRQRSVIEGIKFSVSIAQTSGTALKVVNCEHTLLQDIQTESVYNAIFIQDSFDTHIVGKTYFRNSVFCDLLIQGTGAQTCVDTFFYGILGEGVSGNTTKYGLILDSGISGVYGSKCDFTQGLVGVNVQNSTVGSGGTIPEYVFLDTILTDSNASSGWLINANCKAFFYTNCWGSTAGAGSGFILASGTGHFLTDCKAIGNTQHGISIQGANEIQIRGGVFSGNSLAVNNTYSGISVNTLTSGWSISEARLGNISAIGGGTQKYGIEVQGFASDNYKITGNDVRGNGTAGISDSGTGVNKRIHDNIGFNPRGYVAAIGMPASTVAQPNPYGIDANVYIVGGTVSAIEVFGTSWVTTGIIAGSLRVPAGGQIRITYTVAPTWTWLFD